MSFNEAGENPALSRNGIVFHKKTKSDLECQGDLEYQGGFIPRRKVYDGTTSTDPVKLDNTKSFYIFLSGRSSMSKVAQTTIIFIGHGSRTDSSNLEFENLIKMFAVRKDQGEVRTVHGYVELAKPSFTTVFLEELQRSQKVILLPVFLFASLHVKNDIPLMVAKAQKDFPEKDIYCANAIRASHYIIQLALKRIEEKVYSKELTNLPNEQVPNEQSENECLLVVGRGSSDPDSNGEFDKVVRLIFEASQSSKTPFSSYHSAVVGITKPSVEDQLKVISRIRPKRLVVLPYFLFKGRLVDQLNKKFESFQKQYPWVDVVIANPLGVDSLLVDYFKEQVDQVLSGEESSQLPCNTCHYRPEIGSIANKVKGIKALLWSVRHLYTHSQAKPHEYPHANLKKHVFICENIDCANRGSKTFARELRKYIRGAQKSKLIKVTRTSCMGRCGEGPTMAVYPDGVWYRNIEQADIKDIFDEHLMNDRILERRVDDIMV